MNAAEIHAARRRIAGRIRRTPLVEVPAAYVARDDIRLFLKLECAQSCGAFKARGAANFIARLLEEGAAITGVITYSSGNHGRAVAEAARAAGLAATVVVPETIDTSKAAAIRAAGAEVISAGPDSETRRLAALDLARERGLTVVPPFDHPWIIAGQGTAAVEILEDLPDVVGVWVPVGGGGLAAGVTALFAGERPSVRVYCVEPEGAAPLAASMKTGKRAQLERTASVADGLLPVAIGELNWRILSEGGVEAVTVTEAQILHALSCLRQKLAIPAEPSGAVAPAPLLARAGIGAGSSLVPSVARAPAGVHVAIVSGGNIAPERLATLLALA